MDDKKLREFTEGAKEASRFSDKQRQQAYQAQRAKGSKETELYDKWVAGGRKKNDPNRTELLSSLDNLVVREARKRIAGTGGTIPQSAVEARLRTYADRALHSYDPTKGTKLTTHLQNQFQAVTDDIARWRNLQKIPKARQQQMATFENARSELSDTLGRSPTLPELQSALPHLPKAEVGRLFKEVRAEKFSDLEADHQRQAPNMGAWEIRQAYQLRKARMPQDVKDFGDLYYPRPGTAQPSIAQIAQKLGITPARAYKLKDKLEKHLKGSF